MEAGRVKGFRFLALWVSSLFLCMCGSVGAAGESGLTNQCSKDLQSVMTCLNFAQGKVTQPTKECCNSVASIKDNEPKCLCFILQQTQSPSGAQNLKSLGVQQDKLLQLPTACQLKNASVSECPKLLGLSPSSPDAAIFTNASSTAAKTTPSTGTPSSSARETIDDSKSSGTKLDVVDSTLLIASAIFFYALPVGFASLF